MMAPGFALEPRLRVGSAVRVDDRPVEGHCRTPLYLRGRHGTVVAVLGAMRDPVGLAYHRPGLPPQILYRVRFEQSALWPGYAGAAGDTLEADLYETWLREAGDA